MANLKEAFVIRPADTNENEFMITIGNHLATEEKFKSRKAAEMRINKTDWNLVAALVCALKKADEFEKSIKKQDRKSTRLNSSHSGESRMPSSA